MGWSEILNRFQSGIQIPSPDTPYTKADLIADNNTITDCQKIEVNPPSPYIVDLARNYVNLILRPLARYHANEISPRLFQKQLKRGERRMMEMMTYIPTGNNKVVESTMNPENGPDFDPADPNTQTAEKIARIIVSMTDHGEITPHDARTSLDILINQHSDHPAPDLTETDN